MAMKRRKRLNEKLMMKRLNEKPMFKRFANGRSNHISVHDAPRDDPTLRAAMMRLQLSMKRANRVFNAELDPLELHIQLKQVEQTLDALMAAIARQLKR